MFLSFSDIFDSKSPHAVAPLNKRIKKDIKKDVKKDKPSRISQPNSHILGDITNYQKKLNYEKNVLSKIKTNTSITKLLSHKYFLEDDNKQISRELPKTKYFVSQI